MTRSFISPIAFPRAVEPYVWEEICQCAAGVKPCWLVAFDVPVEIRCKLPSMAAETTYLFPLDPCDSRCTRVGYSSRGLG